jgi:hypothetical protein
MKISLPDSLLERAVMAKGTENMKRDVKRDKRKVSCQP